MNKLGTYVAIESDPVLRAILGWYFRHGGEGTGPNSPDWSHTTVGQISVLTAIHGLAAQVADRTISEPLTAIAAKGLSAVTSKLEKAASRQDH